MNSKLLKELSEKLSNAQAGLSKAEGAKRTIDKAGATQSSITVNVGGYHIDVTSMDRCYMQSVIRGREMIYLGAKKMVNASIDEWKLKVKSIEDAISAEVNGGAK